MWFFRLRYQNFFYTCSRRPTPTSRSCLTSVSKKKELHYVKQASERQRRVSYVFLIKSGFQDLSKCKTCMLRIWGKRASHCWWSSKQILSPRSHGRSKGIPQDGLYICVILDGTGLECLNFFVSLWSPLRVISFSVKNVGKPATSRTLQEFHQNWGGFPFMVSKTWPKICVSNWYIHVVGKWTRSS